MTPLKTVLLGSATLALAAIAAPAEAQTRCGADYTVRSGDTLYEIAQQCRVPVSRIMNLNPRLDPRAMEIGQRIRLSTEAGTGYEDRRNTGPGEYRVQQGDNFSAIATRLGLSLFELIAANEDIDPFNLQPGDRIDVPGRDDIRGAFSIEPHTGSPGDVIEISARNLRPNDWVTIGVGPQASEWEPVRQIQTDENGQLDTSVRVPSWSDPGDDLIFLVDTDRGRTLKSDVFDVVDRYDRWRDDRGDRDDDHTRWDDRQREDRRDDWMTLTGEVSMGTECHVLTTRDGDVYSLVSDDIRFTNGEHVRIRGDRVSASFCQQGQTTIAVNEIREMPRDHRDDRNRGGEVALQGEVRQGVECHTLHTDNGSVYSIVSDDIPLTTGEYVMVEGQYADISYCQQGEATLEVETLREVPRSG
ncbi:LysM peptidoglycan-binding domain-containing protein [Hyphobacterium sp. SN044]|uniref:LysM peptidoglycan-binding domain-containing protein n=1 Tax=Hyphobacterium sp. SN044 TaxID=2912575 RepID=UPI001F168EED|nr:LysM peptidoglycan-binding domain-containing protein [Hyphobacterium sp. SN044]MCF8879095.1 LysM peptidoglycan-binding domain-containing protein [Hyphobacterium sp. SN044]